MYIDAITHCCKCVNSVLEEVALTTNKIWWVCHGTSLTGQAGMHFGSLKEHMAGH
jgi:hypothetical protein